MLNLLFKVSILIALVFLQSCNTSLDSDPDELDIELNRSVFVDSYTFTSIGCIDSSSFPLEDLSTIFNPINFTYWPYEQIIFISNEELAIRYNSSILSESFTYVQENQSIIISTDNGEFSLLGDTSGITGFGYHYIVFKNGPYGSLVEDNKGSGKLSDSFIDSIRNTLTENDTLIFKDIELQYEEEE